MNPPHDRPALPPGVLVVRAGPGANCSSIGSAVEMLFLSAAVGAAVLAAIAAATRPGVADPADAHTHSPPPPPPPTRHTPAEPPDPTESA